MPYASDQPRNMETNRLDTALRSQLGVKQWNKQILVVHSFGERPYTSIGSNILHEYANST